MNRIFLLAICFSFIGCAPRATPAFEALVNDQMMRYPEMQVQDWYKLLHQAAMGNRHLGVEDSLIYNYLLDELDRIEAATDEPAFDYIAPDSSVIRLNLRPFKAKSGDPDALFADMKATWDTVEPSTAMLESYWSDLKAARSLPYTVADLDAYFEAKRTEGFPAVHHSAVYESTYRPAYRVLLKR